MFHSLLLKGWQITADILFLPLSFPAEPVDVGNEEEDVQFSKLIFRDDFLSDQYFGENHLISIITEKAHFGEGMHRRAFRTKLQGGQVPLLLPGHSCVLKVHNAISYGTKNNDELIQKNFNLAVEVQTQHLPWYCLKCHFPSHTFSSSKWWKCNECKYNLHYNTFQYYYHMKTYWSKNLLWKSIT